MSERTRTLQDVAELVRAKNAGPFWITFDIFLRTDADYEQVAADGAVTQDKVAALYRVDPAGVRIYRLPLIRVVKISFPRPVVQGSLLDRDMHSGQQHVPLFGLSLA